MAEKKKSIIDEAVLDAKRIQETLNANTKEILRSIAKEEIDDLVKESLNEFEEEDVDDLEADTDVAIDADAEAVADDAEEVEADDEIEDIGADVEDMGSSEEGDLAIGDETEMDAEASYGDEMDMTAASDDEVIAVYKKLTGDDEIQIVSNDNGDIELTVNEPGEFVIKADGAGEAVAEPEMGLEPEMELEPAMGGEEVAELPMADLEGAEEEETEEAYENVNESEVVYEIAIDEMEDIESVSAPVGNENDDNWAGDNLEGGFDDNGQNGTGDAHGEHIMEDENVNEEEVNEEEVNEEAIDEKIQVGKGRTVANNSTEIKGAGGKANNVKAPNVTTESTQYVSKADYDKLLAEAKNLKAKTVEMAGTLKEQRGMLSKVVVFNTNLTNVTRLFTEHSTTKEEKRQIIERFDDEVSSIQESKKLFKSIEKELGNKKPISESVEGKISKEKSSSTSKLNESTAYVDQGTKRIMDLISRVENKDKF